jgi:hypothetical protein
MGQAPRGGVHEHDGLSSQGRTCGGMAGRDVSAPPPATHPLAPPDAGGGLLGDQSPCIRLCRGYTWRWQGAILGQAWTSYANRHAMATAALKRLLAYKPQRLVEVPRSTRQVAMGAVPVSGGIVQALKAGDVAGLYDTLEAAITSLACQAQRVYPKRDHPTGRL